MSEKHNENKEEVNAKKVASEVNKEDAKTSKQQNTNETQEEKSAPKQESISKSEFIKLKYQFAEFVNNHKEYEKEFENYKRRTKDEIIRAKEEGISTAVETILPALDSFKKAEKIITDKTTLSGIKLIEKSILTELEKLGVKRIKCVGEPFNADFHNAIMLVEDKSATSGTIVEEVEAGYTLGEKVIKFSRVIVAK